MMKKLKHGLVVLFAVAVLDSTVGAGQAFAAWRLHPPTTLDATGAHLTWARYDGAGSFQGYEVHRSTEAGFTPGASTRLTTLASIDTTSYRDQSASADQLYHYKLTAAGESSNEQSALLPGEGQVIRILQPDSTAGKATFIQNWPRIDWPLDPEREQCANAGADPSLTIDTFGGDAHSRLLLSFDLSTLPSTALISEAYLDLWNQRPSSQASLAVTRVTRSWQEGSSPSWAHGCPGPDGATWTAATTGTPWTTPGGDFDTAEVEASTTLVPGTAERWDEFDVSDVVSEWAAGTWPNHGLLVRLSNEGTAPPSSLSGVTYASDDSANEDIRPRLVVTYLESAPPPLIGAPLAGGGTDQVHNFGGWTLLRGTRRSMFGTRANITNPPYHLLDLPSESLGALRVAVEDKFGRLAQIGLSMNNAPRDGCVDGHTRQTLTYYIETAPVLGTAPRCEWIDSPVISVDGGESNLFTITRVSPGCDGGADPPGHFSWELRMNGNELFCADLVFGRAFRSTATGEVTSRGTQFKDATMQATYGAGQTTPWQFATAIDGGWTSVGARKSGLYAENDSGGWTITSRPPRFTVRNTR